MGCGTSVEAEQVPPNNDHQNATTQNGVRKGRRSVEASANRAELDAKLEHEKMVVDVEGWLQSLQLAEYWPAFETAGYDDLDTVMDMTEEDLNDVGIKVGKGGHVKLVKNIEKLKQNFTRQPSIPQLDLRSAAASAASLSTPAVRRRWASVCVLSPPFLSVALGVHMHSFIMRDSLCLNSVLAGHREAEIEAMDDDDCIHVTLASSDDDAQSPVSGGKGTAPGAPKSRRTSVKVQRARSRDFSVEADIAAMDDEDEIIPAADPNEGFDDKFDVRHSDPAGTLNTTVSVPHFSYGALYCVTACCELRYTCGT
jgi:hypothetical protein